MKINIKSRNEIENTDTTKVSKKKTKTKTNVFLQRLINTSLAGLM